MINKLIHICNELSRIDNIPKDQKYENIRAYSKYVIDSILQILTILYPTIQPKPFMKDFLASSSIKSNNTRQKLTIKDFLHYLYKHNYLSPESSIATSIATSIETSISPSIVFEPDLTEASNYYYILEIYSCIIVELEDKTIDSSKIDYDFIMDEYEYIFMLDTKIRFIILLFLHFKFIKSIKRDYISDLNIATAQLQIDLR